MERGMPYRNGGGSVSSPKQKPLQPPHGLPTQPSGLEVHSIISSRSLRNFRDVAGREQQEKTLTRLIRKRGTLLPLRARTRNPKVFLTPPIRCLTKRRGHNFPYGSWRDSGRFLATRSSTCSFFCAARPAPGIEVPIRDVRNALSRPSCTLQGGSRT